ncbi:MAG: hypothetical protein ACRDD1_16985, partial [Planctomycetia bacterium]
MNVGSTACEYTENLRAAIFGRNGCFIAGTPVVVGGTASYLTAAEEPVDPNAKTAVFLAGVVAASRLAKPLLDARRRRKPSEAVDAVFERWDDPEDDPSEDLFMDDFPLPTVAVAPIVALPHPAVVETPPPREPKRSGSFGWLTACLLVASGLLSHGRIAPPALHPTAHAAPAVAALNTVPIEAVALGRRTLGENPELSDAERAAFVDPDPATWRELRFRMTKADGGGLDVHLRRPLDWIASTGAAVGRTVHLDLAELGAAGPAECLSIGPCPAIEPGAGNVVTGLFRHHSVSNLL